PSSITVGIDTGTAGARLGSVVLDENSDGSGSIGTETVTVEGNVYRDAAPLVTAPAPFIIHAGQTASVAIGLGNTAVADGFSEALAGNVISASAGLAASLGGTGDIAAGSSGTIGVVATP